MGYMDDRYDINNFVIDYNGKYMVKEYFGSKNGEVRKFILLNMQ